MKFLTKDRILIALAALILGAFVALGSVYSAAPSLMMLEDESRYDFDQTVSRFEQEVANAGWKVAGIHDMKAVLAGFGHEVRNVKIYELCSSKYSAVILEQDDERIVSPLMPCRVAIYEKSDGKTYITRMNSILMAKPFGGLINSVMQQAAGETEDILKHLLR